MINIFDINNVSIVTGTYIGSAQKSQMIQGGFSDSPRLFPQKTKRSGVFYMTKWDYSSLIKVTIANLYIKRYSIRLFSIKKIDYDELNNLMLINDDLAIKMK